MARTMADIATVILTPHVYSIRCMIQTGQAGHRRLDHAPTDDGILRQLHGMFILPGLYPAYA